jgi:mono/diheme cytochrome c family protein
MKSVSVIFSLLLLTVLLSACGPDLPPAVAEAYVRLPAEPDYNFDVKPILSDKCFACHGPDPGTRMGKLRLDVAGDSPLLTPEEHRTRARALNGELRSRILSDDPALVMPPPESKLTLSPEEIAVLTKWAETGGAYQDHWAFESPEAPTVPDTEWGHNAIDAFVYERLRREELSPSPPADAATLRRRASLVLTGLPPTDELPTDYPALLDSLLDRPAYGEHMAAYWMDVARYADSDGYLDDKHRRLWPYRDWVIRSFNDNLPYDDFVTQQLAGDLLPEATKETTLATTFNRLHKRNSEAGIVFEEARVEYVADRTLTLGKAFLGLSIECAQCHDHKYDPVSQQDYYATFAMFNSTAELGTAIYGPDQTPGPALLLSSERQDSIIAYLETMIAEREAAQPVATATQTAPALPTDEGFYESFDRLERDSGPGLRGRALHLNEFTHFAFPEKVGWMDRYQPWTMALSLRPDSVYADHGIIYHNEELRLGLKGYGLHFEDNRLKVIMAHSWPHNAIQVVTREALPVGEWTDVVVTYDGSSRAAGFQIFLDGKRAEVTVDYDHLYKGILYEPDIHTYGFRGLEIGKKSKSNLPVGLKIDEFRLYRRDLTSPRDRPTEDTLLALRRRLTDTVDAIPEIMVMGDLPEPRPTYVLDRGMYDAPTVRVEPGVPGAVFPWSASLPRNRLGLARWVTHPDHPLTARVFVNRVWAMHFGRGIVETTEDFGNQGGLPSHPELLDWLARWFVASGWDVKALHRLILESATFRQSSVANDTLLNRDPDNTLLARGPSYRMSAEMIRDQALAAGGLLDRRSGGPSVYPYQPAGLWDELSDKSWRYAYPELTDENRYRRSLYTFRKRTAIHPSQLIFDAPDNSVCTVRRSRSNTPLQALVLLNEPTYREAAGALVQSISETSSEPTEQLRRGYEILLGRSPDDSELDRMLAHFRERGDLTEIMHALMNTTDFYTLR